MKITILQSNDESRIHVSSSSIKNVLNYSQNNEIIKSITNLWQDQYVVCLFFVLF